MQTFNMREHNSVLISTFIEEIFKYICFVISEIKRIFFSFFFLKGNEVFYEKRI